MRDYFKGRKLKKRAKEVLRHAKYIRNMREDIAPTRLLGKLNAAEADLRSAMVDADFMRAEDSIAKMESAMTGVWPRAHYPLIREYTEILVVACSVAMAFRAYFLQPFKIPTGSMEPTLMGIEAEAMDTMRTVDRFPLNCANWLITGEWYREIRCQASGILKKQDPNLTPNSLYDTYLISGLSHHLPRGAEPRHELGAFVNKGDVLWAGVVTAGDHVFVDKVSWNFRRPRRSEVSVFETTGISHPQLPQNKHYIKRCVGLPGEDILIKRPFLYVDGVKIDDDSMIGVIARKEGRHNGYYVPTMAPVSPYGPPPVIEDSVPTNGYYMLGDNSISSFDSRYWKYVPQENLVGRALLVYWPFTRWQWIKR